MSNSFFNVHFQLKTKYGEQTVVLIQTANFYETFGNDADKVAGCLNSEVIEREINGEKVKVTGFVTYDLEKVLPRLIKCGYRVAVCDPVDYSFTQQTSKR